MIVRVIIAVFASLVGGLSYMTGLGKLMTGLLLGFGFFASLFLGILFLLPIDPHRLLFPLYEPAPAWPFFLLALVLAAMMIALHNYRPGPRLEEQVESRHFQLLLSGLGVYLGSMFLSSVYWFPSDAERMSSDPEGLALKVLFGTLAFLAGVSFSCVLLYRASKGGRPEQPDLMRRFVLGLFAFLQLDKMPLFVAYLLVYSPESRVVFPSIAALAMAAYIPVGVFLLRATWDLRDSG